MADDVASVVLRVQAGQATAFIDLVQRLNAELRVWIATYALDTLMIDDVALAVWCAVRRASADCPAAPIPWILAFAERELAQRMTALADDPLRQVLTHAAAVELRAAGQPSTTAAQHVQRRLTMMPPMARRLLTRHYGERLPLADLAVAQGVSNEDVADSLVMARSTLDWHPDAMSGPVAHGPFSGVIEDFLSGALEGEPRERFAVHLAADAERSATFVRQVRLDLMLRVMLAPAVEGDGKVMAQAAWATVASGDGLMIAQPPELRPRPAAAVSQGSDRTQRRPTSSDLAMRRTSDPGTRRITANEPTTRRISVTELGTRRHSLQRLEPDAGAGQQRKSGLLVVFILAGLVLAGGVAVLLIWGRGETARAHPLVTQADPAPLPTAPPASIASAPVPGEGHGPSATGARTDGPVVFVRGINFGGDAVILDRHRWLAQDQAVAGGLALTAEAVATSIPPLSGAGFDFDGKAMLESGLSAKEAPLRLRQALPAGTYELMLWVAGPDAGNALAITIGDQIGNVAAAPSATWRKLGPYRVTLTGAQLDLVVAGLGRAHLSGLTLATVGKPSAPLPPIALLISPSDRFAQDSTRSLDLVADVIPSATAITAVAFMDGDKLLATVNAPPYRLSLPKLPPGTFAFTVVATAADGGRAASAAVTGTILDLPVGTGSILRERWNGLPGEWLRDAQANPKLQGPPDQSSMLTSMKIPTNDGFDFVDRLRGFIIPPVNGSYTFWIASDDNAELSLSTDEDPAHLQFLCWCGVVREEGFDDRPEQRSKPLVLEAGHRYFVEVRHKQGPGGTHLAIGWQLPDGYRERPIPGSRIAPWTAERAPLVAAAPPASAPVPAPTAPTPAAEKPPRFALGIDFGGDAGVIDGNHWLSQRQAEELEVPLLTTTDTFLSDLPLADAQVGFGGLRRDVDLDGRPLTIGKGTFKRGLFTHAPATILVPLDGRSTGFIADVGVESYVGQGSVAFEVYLDDAKVAESGVVHLGDEAKHLEVPLGRAKVMKLVVGDGGDGLGGDHAIWGDARLITPRVGLLGAAAGLKGAKRNAQNFATKPPSEGPLKAMLNSSCQGRSETLAFGLKVPNGVYDAWFWVSENATTGAHLFDLEVQGVAAKGLGALPTGSWSKYGPLRVSVGNGVLSIIAKAGKGVPTLSGMALYAIDP